MHSATYYELVERRAVDFVLAAIPLLVQLHQAVLLLVRLMAIPVSHRLWACG